MGSSSVTVRADSLERLTGFRPPEPQVVDFNYRAGFEYPKGGRRLEVVSDFRPTGDQPEAIRALADNIRLGSKNQVLLGVTGSGKTFSMAHVIMEVQRPALILAHNKTLAAQLYAEMKDFFPHNAVEYFVSYYDYYQPEAFVPRTNTYIDKELSRNEQIERLRHAATRSLLERRDVIIVSSVSCLFGIGGPETYADMVLDIRVGASMDPLFVASKLTELQYKRNDHDFSRGTFRVRGDVVDIFPAHLEDCAWRVSFFDDNVESIASFDPLTGKTIDSRERLYDADTGQPLDASQRIRIYPNSHYVTPRPTMQRAMVGIRSELQDRMEAYAREDLWLERERLEQKSHFDLELMETTGSCPGVENYSRYLTGRNPGEPPPTLFEYLPPDALLFVDESHVTVPQIGAMFRGDFGRKATLAQYGFRLPSCVDNRPLRFEEWERLRPQTVFVSATPSDWEIRQAGGAVVEQVVRPTGLADPRCFIRPVEGQVDDLIAECQTCVHQGDRVLVTTLTKRMSEDLSAYMTDAGLKTCYLHSDIETLERVAIIRDLRLGVYDVLVGINLLREGLDIPECSLVAILDADKEGFLRSKTSLIQTIGRAARNLRARAILYADRITPSIRAALDETQRRRERQEAYNAAHGITPSSIQKAIRESEDGTFDRVDRVHVLKKEKLPPLLAGMSIASLKVQLRDKMFAAAERLDFERAARLRDELAGLETQDEELPVSMAKFKDELVSLYLEDGPTLGFAGRDALPKKRARSHGRRPASMRGR